MDNAWITHKKTHELKLIVYNTSKYIMLKHIKRASEDTLPMGDVLTVRLNSHSVTTDRQYSHEPVTNT